ncbi:MAG: A24 family peptidase, partial [Candidatus Neomarinimicrobiota bacterium]
ASLSYIILSYILLVVAFIDLDHLVVPNGIIVFGIVAGMILLSVNGLSIGWNAALLGAVTVSGFLYLTGVLGKLLFRKQSMGLGDVKLGALIGLFVGWKWAIVLLFLTFYIAALVGLAGLVTNRMRFGQRIPFGPFLSLGTISTLFFGDFIWDFIILKIILR